MEQRRVHSSTDYDLPFLSFCNVRRVLDIGCGKGVILEKLAERFKIEGVGIDIVALRTINTSSLKLMQNFSLSKMKSLTSFSGLGSIEHCKSTQKVIYETFRTLKNNGQVLFTVPNKLSLHTLVERPVRQLLKKWSIGLEQSFSVGQLFQMFQITGFRNVNFKLNAWQTKRQKSFFAGYI